MSQKRVAIEYSCDNISTIPKQILTHPLAMNTSDKNSTALETLSFIAVVTCVLSAAWFLATNLLA